MSEEYYNLKLDKLPKWFVFQMKIDHIPYRFRKDDLDNKQQKSITTLAALFFMVKNGCVDVIFDGNTPPRFKPFKNCCNLHCHKVCPLGN